MAVDSFTLNVDEVQYLADGTRWVHIDPRYDSPKLVSFRLGNTNPADGEYLQMWRPAVAAIVVDIESSGALTSTWNYDPTDAGPPGQGEINHGDAALLRVATRDSEGTDQTAELIQFGDGDGILLDGVVYTILSRTVGGTGANTYFDFGVTPETQGTLGLQTVTFSHTAEFLTLFPYDRITGLAWDADAANAVAGMADALFPGFRRPPS